MEAITQILSDDQFNQLIAPHIPDYLIGEPLMKLVTVKGFILDLDVLYIPNYYHLSFLLAIEQN